jgi:arylsulfatase A-like enzyme
LIKVPILPRSIRIQRLLLLLAMSTCALVACSEESSSTPETTDRSGRTRPNLILISVDTLRSDHLSVAGYWRNTSPHFDQLAAQGVFFERAFSPTSWTLPGHASMLTGVNPTRHGAHRWKSPISKDVPLLAEILSEAGYATKGVVNGNFVKAQYGFDRGFDSYSVYFGLDTDEHQAAVLDVLDAREDRPFFYFFHYMRVHSPYLPPKGDNPFMRPFDGEVSGEIAMHLEAWNEQGRHGPVLSEAENDHLIDMYDGAIWAMDALLAEVLARLEDGDLSNSYVILTSDHGEEFMDHDLLGHSLSIFDEVISVPLMIRGPGIEPGQRVDALAGLIDVVPTSLDLLNIEPPPGLEGRSLRPMWEDGEQPDRTLVLMTSFPTGDALRLGMRGTSGKLVIAPEDQTFDFYHLGKDPAEQRPLPLTRVAVVWRTQLNPLFEVRASDSVDISDEELQQLDALGYIHSPVGED